VNRLTIRPLALAALALLAAPAALRAQSHPTADLASREAIQRQAPDTLSGALQLLPPGEAVRDAAGRGVSLRYWLRAEPRALLLEVLDARGRVVRSWSSTDSAPTARPGMKRGMNELAWDLRHAGVRVLERGRPHPGPLVLPGSYRVRLTMDGDTAARRTQPLVVAADPRDRATPTDRAEQVTFLVRARDRAAETVDAVRRIRSVRAQLAERESRLPIAERARVMILATVLRERLDRIEHDLHGAGDAAIDARLAAVSAAVARATRPSPDAYAALNMASMDLDKRTIELREEMTRTLPRVNDVIQKAGLAPVMP
jgi:hypothetical protein